MIRGVARYRIIPAITLRAEYSYEDISRNASEWNEPDSTRWALLLYPLTRGLQEHQF
jgi:hypothetical protein